MILRLNRLRFRRNSTPTCRGIVTAASHDPTKTRNIALVAHIDSGKTTLTESILLSSSYLSSSGSVDTGSTTTDFLPAERERGITIQSASIPVKWKDWSFNLIDTPGHADFGMEVESASRVIDGAVVLIDSVEGVEAQTKGVWRQLDRYMVPTRIMFLNKLDRPGASFKSSVQSLLSHRLHPTPMALTLPIASFDPKDYLQGEPGIQGLVDLVNWDIWKWDADGVSFRHPLPHTIEEFGQLDILPSSHPILPHLVPARSALLENLAMFSEELMESLLNMPSGPSCYMSIMPSTVMRHLREATLRNDILPVLCGSAMKNIGTTLMMDYVGELLASPLDIKYDPQSKSAPLRILAWKVGWDKRKGWMTFVRVYSGTLTRQSVIVNTTRKQREKVSKLLLLYASEAEEVDELPFGSVGVILGLKYTRTGDTLASTFGTSSPSSTSPLRDIVPPPAVMSASVIPQSHSDLGIVEEALQSLVRTDPSVRVETQDGQILVHGLGALHLEIVEGRLRDEWDARFEFGRRRVSYREGLCAGSSETTTDTWKTEVAGKSVTISITLSVEPMADGENGDPAWNGNVVVDQDGKALPFPETQSNQLSALAYIARGLASTLSISPHTSLALSRIQIRVDSFQYPVEVPPSILTGAAAVILRNRIRDAGMGPVMEPYMHLKISVNEENLGKVVRDLTEHGGEVVDLRSGSTTDADGMDSYGGHPEDGVYIPPDWLSPSSASLYAMKSAVSSTQFKRSIYAVAPLSKVLDYSNRLRALSAGHGLFEMTNAGFRKVAEGRKLEILKEIGRA